ncbi:DNA uptake protein ComE-like DNA-binding protein [Chitinophaga niastensis]|uniref:DNA uptake protein ComE-like DNA-binding protein n=1 Tax=Chitinophaga niastensis TaxID=536980 RepID=A0A2P8HRB3_CHINA|nr:helix-hairpin-helix domain-containing protein [Chitinophaga niastensis]PSL48751.1 DNA uptake protein ComE-like DNA-binding protein [Chitinophaga niastensis]
MWKSFAREYLRFSRKERSGILLLVGLILLTCQMPDILFHFQRIPVTDTSNLKLAVAVFEAQMLPASLPDEKTAAAPLFYFDPNTLPVADWLRLGVSERTAQTIQKYLSKGGHFRQPGDLQKIYGISPALCAKLLPFVSIAGDRFKGDEKTFNRDTAYRKSWTFKRDTAFTRFRAKPPASIIDINTSDTLVWQTLPGIGAGFARRIVAFRDKLGGFYAVAQVSECYGLPDSTFQKIQPFLQISNSSLKKMDLNSTDEKSLAAHPYIRYKLARLIVQYRSAHAGFRQVDELRALPLVDEIIYRKIEHYIEIKL